MIWSFINDTRASKKDSREHCFYCDGKHSTDHTHSVLTLVERPKKMVTKTIERWANVYSDECVYIHHSREKADVYDGGNRIACVKLTGTYEVEEEG